MVASLEPTLKLKMILQVGLLLFHEFTHEPESLIHFHTISLLSHLLLFP